MSKILVLRLTHYFDGISPWYEKHEGSKRGNNGIGNMLFQIAAARAFCLDKNYTLFVPDIEVWAQKEGLDKNMTIFKAFNTSQNFPQNLPLIKKKGNNDKFPNINDSTQVNGYFEHTENFIRHIDTIKKDFRPTAHFMDTIHHKYPFIYDNNLCSIHIRRGRDYMEIFGEKFMNELDNYYIRAINFMMREKNITNFLVFSNDLEYSKQLLSQISRPRFHYSTERDFEEIWMMTLIKNNIVSHSTFSIWGAYLNRNKNAFIICPKVRKEFYSLPSWHIM